MDLGYKGWFIDFFRFVMFFYLNRGICDKKNSNIFFKYLKLKGLGLIGTTCNNYSTDYFRSYTDSAVNVSNCIFSRTVYYSGNGGIIYNTVSSNTMIISYSVFYNCSSTSDGGAIYVNTKNNTLKMVCAHRCNASRYHFAYLKTLSINDIDYLSFSKCSYGTTGFIVTFIIEGVQNYYNSNCSLNMAMQTCGIAFNNPTFLSSFFCTFSENIGTSSRVILFGLGKGQFSYANIINNRCGWDAITLSSGTFCFNYTVFINNKIILFRITGTLSIINSIVFHIGTLTSDSPIFDWTNNTDTIGPTFQIQFYSTHSCHADLPKTENIGTKPNTKGETPYRTYDEVCSFDNRIRIQAIYLLSLIIIH